MTPNRTNARPGIVRSRRASLRRAAIALCCLSQIVPALPQLLTRAHANEPADQNSDNFWQLETSHTTSRKSASAHKPTSANVHGQASSGSVSPTGEMPTLQLARMSRESAKAKAPAPSTLNRLAIEPETIKRASAAEPQPAPQLVQHNSLPAINPTGVNDPAAMQHTSPSEGGYTQYVYTAGDIEEAPAPPQEESFPVPGRVRIFREL